MTNAIPIQRVAVFGSTGSVGRSTLEVIDGSEGRMEVIALTAHQQLGRLVDQANRYQPRWLVASDPITADGHNWSGLCPEITRLTGPDALEAIAAADEIDCLVAAIVGSAGLRSTWAAVEAGKKVALANKETLVVAGPLVTQLAEKTGATLLPVDSEHSAVFQALATGRREDVKRVILTASGGPFRNSSAIELQRVTVAQALSHPTWEMGPKISVDSATMMNKALEIVEARWLFGLEPDQICVVIHPQSIIHSLVEFVDGSVIAQLSPPDMKLPIQFALTYPQRCEGPAAKMNWTETYNLQLQPPDLDRFPAIALGLEVARVGGTAGAVVNAANEAAVDMFLAEKLRFTDIVPACRHALEQHHFDPSPTLDQLLKLDRWAREEVTQWATV